MSQSFKNRLQLIVLPSKFTKGKASFSYDSISLDRFNFILNSVYATAGALRIIYCFYQIGNLSFWNTTDFQMDPGVYVATVYIISKSYVTFRNKYLSRRRHYCKKVCYYVVHSHRRQLSKFQPDS